MNILREFFFLHKSDRHVVTVLLCIIAASLTIIYLTSEETAQTDGSTADDSDSTARFTTLHDRKRGNSTHYARHAKDYYAQPAAAVERFPFDPNTADSTQLLRLGLQPWQVRNIYKYRAAGGVYRRPADFARLYGLTVKQYRELEPYIRISSDYLPAATLVEKEQPPVRDTGYFPRKIGAEVYVVLNTADTTELRRVPGIGPYYAAEIMRYGQRLGGFVSTDQLDEIDNFPVESKKFFIIANPSPKKLNVNKLSLNELKRHPYINFYQARAITDYRRLRGPLHSLQELSLIKDFPPEAIKRLEPYVEF